MAASTTGPECPATDVADASAEAHVGQRLATRFRYLSSVRQLEVYARAASVAELRSIVRVDAHHLSTVTNPLVAIRVVAIRVAGPDSGLISRILDLEHDAAVSGGPRAVNHARRSAGIGARAEREHRRRERLRVTGWRERDGELPEFLLARPQARRQQARRLA